MSIQRMLNLALDNLVGMKFCAVVFWCAVVVTTFGRVFNSADVMTISMIFTIMMGFGYLYNKTELQRLRVEISERMGFDHLLKR